MRAAGRRAVWCYLNWLSEAFTPRELSSNYERIAWLYWDRKEIPDRRDFQRIQGLAGTDVWDQYPSAGKLVWGFAQR